MYYIQGKPVERKETGKMLERYVLSSLGIIISTPLANQCLCHFYQHRLFLLLLL